MTRILTSTLGALLFMAITGSAAAPKVGWVFHAGGTKHDKLRALTVDEAGCAYLTGEFSDTVKFGNLTRTASGSMDFVLMKLNPKGQLMWVTTAGGDKIDRGYAVAVDQTGNSYVTGHYQSETITFGTTVLTNRGDYDVFIAKYAPDGKALWAIGAGGAAYDFGHGIAMSQNEAVVVSGMIRGPGAFKSGHPISAEGIGPFLARISLDGRLEWTRQVTGKGSGSGHEVAVDNAGNIYLGGFFAGTADFGPHQLKTTKGRDLYATKLNSQGEYLWAAQAGGASDGLVSGICADQAGGCFVAGMFKATAKLGDKSFSSAGNHDFYLSRIDASGHGKWTVHAGGPDIDYGLGLAVDEKGNALLTGETTGNVTVAGMGFHKIGKRDLYAAKFSSAGKLLWGWQAGGTLNSLSYAAGCGPNGLNVIAGAFSGEIRIGKDIVVSQGSNDIIVVGLLD